MSVNKKAKNIKEVPLGEKHPIPVKLAKVVQSQFAEFSRQDLSAYTFEKHHSNFKDARNDLTVYDPAGKLVLHGRDFGDRTFFWQP